MRYCDDRIGVCRAGFRRLFADFGHDVVCVDKDAAKIEALKGGVMPIFEPGLADLVAANRKARRLSFTTELAPAVAEADVVFIAVGTPSRRGDGHADLGFVHAVANDIAPALRGFTVVATKSTVPVGTGDEIERIIREANPNADVCVVSNPEFLREGAAIEDFKRPDRIVIGFDDERARDVMTEVYRPALSQSGPSPVHRAADGGAGEVCGERVPRDEDHLHQRDRRPLRSGER